jgi:acetyltransferase
MQKLFNPKTVAIIGASSNPMKWGNWLAEEVVRHIDKRRVYFVNPKKEIIFGIPSLSRIDHIPEPIELAIVAVHPDLFEGSIDDLILHGTDIIVGITSGIKLDVQNKVVEKCRASGVRLIGPNCAGVWSGELHCLPIGEFTSGPVAMISQSGGVLVDVYDRLKEVGLGFSKALSIGNQTDLSFKDVLPFLEEDPATKIIVLYVENTDSIPYSYIRLMTKPVLILSTIATPMAKTAAEMHTNSKLTYGEITSISDLIAKIQLSLYNRTPKGNNIAVITDSGGIGVLINSLAERSGLNITSYTDLIGIPSAFSEKSYETIKEALHSPNIDAIVANLHLYNNAYDERSGGILLADLVKTSNKPVIFSCRSFTNPGVKVLLDNNIPVYRDIETAIKMLSN